MTKIDQLIEKFKEFKEELNKNVNMSTMAGGSSQPSMVKFDKNGQWYLDKGERKGVNRESDTPHNKGSFKVMPMTSEKESKKAATTGLPYNGKDKDVKKGETCSKCKCDPCKCA